MGIIVAVIVALIGGFVQSGRHPDRLAVDVHMVWWMAVVAAGSVLGAGYLIFDGAQTAEWIGYARGDGGFQWQTAMSELAIGVLGTMAYWFRGYFWLATIVALTTQSVGDAAGHIYYTVVHSNSRPYNFGLLLCTDVLLPTVMWALYAMSWRKKGDAVPKSATRQVAPEAQPDNIGPDVQCLPDTKASAWRPWIHSRITLLGSPPRLRRAGHGGDHVGCLDDLLGPGPRGNWAMRSTPTKMPASMVAGLTSVPVSRLPGWAPP